MVSATLIAGSHAAIASTPARPPGSPRMAGSPSSPAVLDDCQTAKLGRVGVWRGGFRLSMSVAAPFVWRCLSGSTVAPFPYPLIGRVGDWRAGLGGSLCSLLARSFGCECHTLSAMPRFQPGPRRTQHADFSHCALPPERKRQFAQPLRDPIRLDGLEVLLVHARRALVGAALCAGVRQNVLAADLVVEEPLRRPLTPVAHANQRLSGKLADSAAGDRGQKPKQKMTPVGSDEDGTVDAL